MKYDDEGTCFSISSLSSLYISVLAFSWFWLFMGFLWSGYGKTSFIAKYDDSKGFLHPLGKINPDMRVFGVCVKGVRFNVRFFILPFFLSKTIWLIFVVLLKLRLLLRHDSCNFSLKTIFGLQHNFISVNIGLCLKIIQVSYLQEISLSHKWPIKSNHFLFWIF